MYAFCTLYVHMRRRTTIEIDEDVLARARHALGLATTRETVEEALRRAAEHAEGESARLAAMQSAYLARLPSLADVEVLRSDEMWR
jgi:Arc/MetJ family transcription regulator